MKAPKGLSEWSSQENDRDSDKLKQKKKTEPVRPDLAKFRLFGDIAPISLW